MAATDTNPGTDSIRVPRRTGPVLTREQSRVIWLLLAAAFVAILNETTMGVAIPHLMVDLGITALQAQWLTTSFMLTMAIVIPITGFLLRRFTTRAMFVDGHEPVLGGHAHRPPRARLPDPPRRPRRAGVGHRDHDAAADDDDHDGRAAARRAAA